MKKVLDIASGCSILDASIGLGVPLILDRVGGPQLIGLDPINAQLSQFDSRAIARVSVALGHCVTPKTNGPRVENVREWSRLANRGSGQVLDPALPPTSTSIGDKAVPSCFKGEGQEPDP